MYWDFTICLKARLFWDDSKKRWTPLRRCVSAWASTLYWKRIGDGVAQMGETLQNSLLHTFAFLHFLPLLKCISILISSSSLLSWPLHRVACRRKNPCPQPPLRWSLGRRFWSKQVRVARKFGSGWVEEPCCSYKMSSLDDIYLVI